MRYPTCYVVVCDGDSAVNFAAFNQQPLKEYTASTTDAPLSHALSSVPSLGPTQLVEQLNQWIQIRSSLVNDLRRPIRSWTRFSKTITTYYYPTILYQTYWIFRGYHSKEVGSTWDILFNRLREALRGQLVMLKLVCLSIRKVKNLNEDKATKRRSFFKHFYSLIARLKLRYTSP